MPGDVPGNRALAGSNVRGIAELRVRGFRSIVDLTYVPGRLSALVGEARAGKSNLLAAANVLLDPSATLSAADHSTLGENLIVIEAALQTGVRLRLEASGSGVSRTGAPLPVLFLPASERATSLVAAGTRARRSSRVARRASRYPSRR